MAINRVQVIWAGPQVQGGGLSTFYFDDTVGTAAQQVAAVGAFLAATEDRRSSSMTWTTNGDVATLNIATGALEGVTSVAQLSGIGTQTGVEYLSPTTQGLLRILTPTVVAGRLLRGRIFLPGSTENDNQSGGPIPAYRLDYDNAAAVLFGDVNTQWSVWSLTHGARSGVTAANVWSKWAVLRSRRD